VTHACFDPKTLAGFYPRGGKALLGPFHQFQPRDTVAWFEGRGVPLKTEPDGRMFPVSDSSLSIIDALQKAAHAARVQIRTQVDVTAVAPEDGGYRVMIGKDEAVHASKVLFAAGSGRRALGWAEKLGHTIVPPVPSLFTFHIPDKRLRGLEGISVPKAEVFVAGTKLKQSGPLLITHHGLSGPAILKLSAWGARQFYDAGYHVEITINWINWTAEKVEKGLRDMKGEFPRKMVYTTPTFETPRRLWERLLASVEIPDEQVWADLTRDQMARITSALTKGTYVVRGQNPFKEEFVTCGGVSLDEVNFKTMESRRSSGLYFAGEILDIDAVTGGFNFQSAWTTGFLAGQAMAR
jgi:predicted Rossmann fold flavoprotein